MSIKYLNAIQIMTDNRNAVNSTNDKLIFANVLQMIIMYLFEIWENIPGQMDTNLGFSVDHINITFTESKSFGQRPRNSAEIPQNKYALLITDAFMSTWIFDILVSTTG